MNEVSNTCDFPDLDALKKLAPSEMRKLLAERYSETLARTVTSAETVELYACLLHFSDPRKRDERINKGHEFIQRITAGPTDFKHWAKAAYWTIDEAAALLCGLEPKDRHIADDIAPLAEHFAVARSFCDIQQLLLRENGNRIHERLQPDAVVGWAEAFDISVPAPLLDAVRRFKTPPTQAAPADKPPDSRIRTTLLNIIGALADAANLDLSQHYKAGDTVAAMLATKGVTYSGRAIGEHLKAVREAMDSRKAK